MNNNSYIPQPSLSFIDIKANKKQDNIWKELEGGIWRNFDIQSYLDNNLLLPQQKHLQKPVFSEILQIEPGVLYDGNTKQLKLDLYYPKDIKSDFNLFISAAEHFFSNLNAKRIGVHLSGGLDSSIIISLLRYLDIPFVPIGLYSETFEFRTERRIQEKLLEWGEDGELIAIEEFPFYSGIKAIPKHQIPCGLFKGYAGSMALAKAFHKKGCDVVLTGQGGDSLFVESSENILARGFNIGDEFMNGEEIDLVYQPYGIRLVSFYSSQNLIDIIVNERKGQKEDALKWWARKWMKDLLIPELSEYAYFADFLGLTMWGLHNSLPDIKELLEEASDFLHNPIFFSKNIRKFISQDIYSFEHKDYIKFCGLISIAVWLHSLHYYNA